MASNGRMIDELERIWKETILAVIELLSQSLPEGNKLRKSSLGLDDVPTGIRTQHHPYTPFSVNDLCKSTWIYCSPTQCARSDRVAAVTEVSAVFLLGETLKWNSECARSLLSAQEWTLTPTWGGRGSRVLSLENFWSCNVSDMNLGGNRFESCPQHPTIVTEDFLNILQFLQSNIWTVP
jgi:hypothetical protein